MFPHEIIVGIKWDNIYKIPDTKKDSANARFILSLYKGRKAVDP